MSIRIAFVVAMLAMAPALARADDLPCPDPAPIYALRNDEAAIKRLLALPRPRPVRPSDRAEEFITVMRRAWNVRLARVWAPRDRHCHIGVLVAELVEDAVSEDGRGTFLLEERIVLIELAREPGPPRFVMGPRLSHWDWLAVGDPEVGDLDADGIPEALFRAGFGGLASCWGMTGDDCYCSVPATQALRVGREDHAPALAVGGGHTDPAILERARAELDAVSSSGPPEQCPAFTPRWVHWKPVGQPRFGRIDGGYAMDLVVDRRECRGWLDAEEEVFGACRGRTRISIRHEVRGTQVETTERPYTPTSIVADADARLLVVPWHLYDGDPRPHPLPVTIGSREGGRARRTGRGARGLTLDPGFYLVEVRRGTNRITYQVAIAPGDANVHLASPAEARP